MVDRVAWELGMGGVEEKASTFVTSAECVISGSPASQPRVGLQGEVENTHP